MQQVNQVAANVDIAPWALSLTGAEGFEITGADIFDSGLGAIFHLCEKTRPKQLSAQWARYVAFSAATQPPSVLAVSFQDVTDQQIADLAAQFQGELNATVLVLRKRDSCQVNKGQLVCQNDLLPSAVVKAKVNTQQDSQGNQVGFLEGPIQRVTYDASGNVVQPQ